MVKSALPPEEQEWYYTIEELAYCLGIGKAFVSKKLYEWSINPHLVLRVYFRAKQGPLNPWIGVPMFHLKDVFTCSEVTKWKLSRELYEQMTEENIMEARKRS